jgi:hypothetical protein
MRNTHAPREGRRSAKNKEKPQPGSGGQGPGLPSSGRLRNKAVTLRAIPVIVCFRCYLGSEADVG